jgi:NAD(P)-dependent dehydrogenase (short-subunit alcohol dehydrogenase family)
MTSKLIAIIAGVGPGTGAAVARKFSTAYPVVLLARTPSSYESLAAEINAAGGRALGISTDVSSASSLASAVTAIKSEFGNDVAAAAAIFNASGAFMRKPFLEIPVETFEKGFGVSGMGGVLFSQSVLPLLLRGVERQGVGQGEEKEGGYCPTLIFTGATASVKSNALMASFSTGKWALRALSQSLAREFGPQGVSNYFLSFFPWLWEYGVCERERERVCACACADNLTRRCTLRMPLSTASSTSRGRRSG